MPGCRTVIEELRVCLRKGSKARTNDVDGSILEGVSGFQRGRTCVDAKAWLEDYGFLLVMCKLQKLSESFNPSPSVICFWEVASHAICHCGRSRLFHL